MVVKRRQCDTAVGIFHRLWREVDAGGKEVFNQVAKNVGINQFLYLMAEIEFIEDFLHVLRKTVEIGDKVFTQALPLAACLQLRQRKFGGVVERLSCRYTQRTILCNYLERIKPFFLFQHRLLGRLQHGIKPAQHGKGQDDIAVFAPHIDIAQAIVGNVPDEIGDPFNLALVLWLIGHCVCS